MKAVLDKNIANPNLGNLLDITGDDAHHLIKALRIREGEEVLVINGAGGKATCEVISIDPRGKSLQLKVCGFEIKRPLHGIELALGVPSRDSFEQVLRASVELGISKIHLLDMEYSDKNFKQASRDERIVKSAVMQSNNLYATQVIEPIKFTDFKYSDFEQVILLSSEGAISGEREFNSSKRTLMMIGPEGGISSTETEFIQQLPNASCIHLKTPILRCATAVAAGVGYLLRN